MSSSPVPLAYATPIQGVGPCPLCNQRPVSNKTLHGRHVCKKCLYKFANRRQLAYLVDILLLSALAFGLYFTLGLLSAPPALSEEAIALITFVLGLGINAVFCAKDGFNGQSPGKMLTGVQVISTDTGKPISFWQSFKRNIVLAVGVLPFVGPIAGLAVVIIIIIQMNKGDRLGDGFAHTRVIWKKYAGSPAFGGADTLCRICQYDLTGNVSGQCPECGTAVAP